MFNFGYTSLWNYGAQKTSNITTLIQKPNLSLEELLDDEDFNNEIKNLSDDLINFLTKEENFKKMIDHVIIVPTVSEEASDFKKYCKFPYLCTEVLSTDSKAISALFFGNKDSGEEAKTDKAEEKSETVEAKEKCEDTKYLDQLFSFLDGKELNYTSTGYFAKIVASFLQKNASDILYYIYKKHSEYLDKIVDHINSESFGDLLLKLLTFGDAMLDDASDPTYHTKVLEVLRQLSQKIITSDDHYEIKHTAYVLSETFGKSKTMHKKNEVLNSLLDVPTIGGYFKLLKAKDPGSVSAGAVILGSIFDHYIITNTLEGSESSPVKDEKKKVELPSTLPIIQVTVSKMQDIVKSIGDTQDGNIPLGCFRLKLIDFVNISREANNKDIEAQICKSEFFRVLLKLFIQYEWHSLLHNQLQKLFVSVLDGKCEEFKISIFENAKILNVLVETFEEDKTTVPAGKKGKKIKKGYLGQLTKIANKINESQDPVILKYVEKDEAWKKFVETTLVEVNRKNTMKLAEVPSENDGEEEPTKQQNDQENKPEVPVANVVVKVMHVKSIFKKIDLRAKATKEAKAIKEAREAKEAKEQEEREERENEERKKKEKEMQDSECTGEENNGLPAGNKSKVQTVPGFKSLYSIFNFSPKGLTSVHALIKKPDLTLDQLLDDENLLIALKNPSRDLIRFLIKPENFTKIIDQIVTERTPNQLKLLTPKHYKLPLVCSEVLSTGSKSIQSTFFATSQSSNGAGLQDNKNSVYLDRLWGFLDREEVSYTAAGYFARVVTSLLENQSNELLTYLYKKRPDSLEKLVRHIASDSLSELLLRLVTVESNVVSDTLDRAYYTKVIQILKLLSQKLDNDDIAKNAAYIISEAFGKCQSMHRASEVLDSLLDKPSIDNYFKMMKTKDVTSISAVSVVLENIFEYYILKNSSAGSEQPYEVQLTSDLPVILATANNIQYIVTLIADIEDGKVSFGGFRLKLTDLVAIAIEANNLDINIKIAKSEFFKIILTLFIQYEWHNLLHNQLQDIIFSVLEGKSKELKVSLFENAEILNVVSSAFEDNKVTIPAGKRGKTIRKGYLGHFTAIANKIVETSNDPVISKYTKDNKIWQEYVKTKLTALNGRNRTLLAEL